MRLFGRETRTSLFKVSAGHAARERRGADNWSDKSAPIYHGRSRASFRPTRVNEEARSRAVSSRALSREFLRALSGTCDLPAVRFEVGHREVR